MATTEFEGNAGEAEPKNACLNHECTFYFKKDGNTLEVIFRLCLRVCRGLGKMMQSTILIERFWSMSAGENIPHIRGTHQGGWRERA